MTREAIRLIEYSGTRPVDGGSRGMSQRIVPDVMIQYSSAIFCGFLRCFPVVERAQFQSLNAKPMSPLKKFLLRLALYGGVVAYLAGDLFVFDGPLRQRMNLSDPGNPQAIAAAKAKGVVARVFNLQITRSQLDRAVHTRLWLEGKSLEPLTPAMRKTFRYAALDELIDHELLRVKAKANAPMLQVNPLLPLSDPFNGSLKRPTPKANS
jgi:hypothetical protein